MTKDGRDIIYDYTIEIDKTGKKRMYASQPGKCIELDPETNEFIDLVYSGGPPPKDI